MNDNPTAHVAVYDGFAEMEVGHLLAELHTGRFTGTSFDLVTVAESREPITSMGGVPMVPDALLADLEPTDTRPCLIVATRRRSRCSCKRRKHRSERLVPSRLLLEFAIGGAQ